MSKYQCNECDDGEIECECCGNMTTCPDCEGECLNPKLVDIKAFKAARAEFWRKHANSGTCAFLVNHEEVGITNYPDRTETLLYADFPAKANP